MLPFLILLFQASVFQPECWNNGILEKWVLMIFPINSAKPDEPEPKRPLAKAQRRQVKLKKYLCGLCAFAKNFFCHKMQMINLINHSTNQPDPLAPVCH
jgi:hypothetical protein